MTETLYSLDTPPLYSIRLKYLCYRKFLSILVSILKAVSI